MTREKDLSKKGCKGESVTKPREATTNAQRKLATKGMATKKTGTRTNAGLGEEREERVRLFSKKMLTEPN